MHGQKHAIMAIMANLLTDQERKEFRHLTNDVSSEDFFKLLSVYLTDSEIKGAISSYVCSQMAEMEYDTGAKIDAVVTIYGSQYFYKNYNEVAGN